MKRTYIVANNITSPTEQPYATAKIYSVNTVEISKGIYKCDMRFVARDQHIINVSDMNREVSDESFMGAVLGIAASNNGHIDVNDMQVLTYSCIVVATTVHAVVFYKIKAKIEFYNEFSHNLIVIVSNCNDEDEAVAAVEEEFTTDGYLSRTITPLANSYLLAYTF